MPITSGSARADGAAVEVAEVLGRVVMASASRHDAIVILQICMCRECIILGFGGRE